MIRLRSSLDGLPEGIRRRLTLENDDRVFSPARLLPVCEAAGVPFVYDVPASWLEEGRDFTLDVEAKAKELAVVKAYSGRGGI